MPLRAVRLGSYALAYLLAVLGLTLVALGIGPRPPAIVPAADAAGPLVAASFGDGPSPTGRMSTEPASGAVGTPAASPVGSDLGIATRVVIPGLGINLPIVAPNEGYPYCNVAMYFEGFGQPGRGRATYVYAHARAGMFLPIYNLFLAGKEAAMTGLIVDLYTSANQRFTYRVGEVRVHQLSIADAVGANSEQLWLQTSEGGPGTPGKTQLIAQFVSSGPAVPADAVPVPHPVVCG